MNEEYTGGHRAASGPTLATDTLELPGMAWDLDVDAFLDDYLKDVDTAAPEFVNYGVHIPSSVKSEPGPGPTSSDSLSEQLAKQASLGEGTASMVDDGRDTPSPPPRSKSMAARKQTALQEKNRRAQRRFRERQKMKVAELEAQVASLTSQLERLTTEHTALAGHAQRLEAALSVAAQREERAAAAAAACSPRAAGAVDDLQRVSPPGAAPALSTSGAPLPPPCVGSAEVTGSAMGVAAAVGAGGVGGLDQAQNGGRGAGEDDGRLPVVFQGDLRLTLRDGQSLSLTAGQLRDMTPAELARYYKTYVNELAQSLVEGGAPTSRVDALVDDVCRLWTRVGLCNPAGVKHFSLTRVEPGSGAGGGPDDRVSAVSRALDLRPEQRASLARLRALFTGKLAGIRVRRRAVVETLARAEPSGTGTRSLAALYLASHEAARSLREALREEHILVLDFESTIFKHVLSNVQVAQLMIHSFPWTPDCLALCTWIAAEAGDADALSALAVEAQRKAAAAAAAAAMPGAGVGMPQEFGGPGALRAMAAGYSPFSAAAGGGTADGSAMGVTPRAASAPSMPAMPHPLHSCGGGQAAHSTTSVATGPAAYGGLGLSPAFGGSGGIAAGMLPVNTAT